VKGDVGFSYSGAYFCTDDEDVFIAVRDPLPAPARWSSPPLVHSLTRQNLPQLEGSSIENAVKGAYVLRDAKDAALTFIATGSEVSLAVETADALAKEGVVARIVSAPCLEIFDQQSREYQLQVLPDGHPIVSIEAYTVHSLAAFASAPPPSSLFTFTDSLLLLQTFGWGKYAHEHVGLNTFGASAPATAVYKKFGLTAEWVDSAPFISSLAEPPTLFPASSRPRPRRLSSSTRAPPSFPPSTRPSKRLSPSL
jgi:pyruvate dehydrogenase complex dehydrogenase (E1) component